DIVMSTVGSGENEAREKSKSFIAAMLGAEATSASARLTVGMLSQRKRIQEEKADEVGPSAYLDEID
ncbi:hypothetical protein C1H46_045088, partial [Malus baccata]